MSWVGGIIIAEHVLGLLPAGTHDWRKFVSPGELSNMLKLGDCQTRIVKGMFYCAPFNSWSWSPSTQINYALHGIKNPKA